jgi:hypothetical protein
LLPASACAATAPQATPAHPAAAHTKVDERPVPPADLDARLIAFYPLRGLVLQESGLARVSFSVATSGVVSINDVSYASAPEYGIACGHMLAGTIWKPARTAGNPVPFSGSFDCRFEHGADPHARTLAPPPAVVPPVQPDYGENWWEPYSDELEWQDQSATLQITVAPDGRVRVDSAHAGSDAEVVKVCTKLLAEGPRWTPAKDEHGAAVEYHGDFSCVLDVKGASPGALISMRNLGASGALAPQQVGVVVAAHWDELTRCFMLSIETHGRSVGKHWLAFEVQPSGTVGRVEWVERGTLNALAEPCLQSALQSYRFDPAPERTIVDIELDIDRPHD